MYFHRWAAARHSTRSSRWSWQASGRCCPPPSHLRWLDVPSKTSAARAPPVPPPCTVVARSTCSRPTATVPSPVPPPPWTSRRWPPPLYPELATGARSSCRRGPSRQIGRSRSDWPSHRIRGHRRRHRLARPTLASRIHQHGGRGHQIWRPRPPYWMMLRQWREGEARGRRDKVGERWREESRVVEWEEGGRRERGWSGGKRGRGGWVVVVGHVVHL